LLAQHVAGSKFGSPRETVAAMGAMQAQDYQAALWAIGLRTQGSTLSSVNEAIDSAEIVRTWPMRGTLHFVAAADLRWMVELMAPRAIAKAAARARGFEIDGAVIAKTRKLLEKTLRGSKRLTRTELYEVLENGGVPSAGQRGIHLIGRLAQEGVICLGPHRGKQPTFVLTEEWLPPGPRFDREDAVAELARRYFTSHGPATVYDFAWWTGLTVTEARSGLEAVATEFESVTSDKSTYWFAPREAAPARTGLHLLPGFDEYILGYTDRAAILTEEHAKKLVPGNNGMFMAAIVSDDGRVLGTWRRAASKVGLNLTPEPFGEFRDAERKAFEAAGIGYARFLDLPLSGAGKG
jgi:hypothetical protein